jgi:hypothetical protein
MLHPCVLPDTIFRSLSVQERIRRARYV